MELFSAAFVDSLYVVNEIKSVVNKIKQENATAIVN